MNFNRLRPYTSLTMAVILFLLVITGWVLYLAPHGQGSRLWLFLGVDKHLYKNLHLCLGVVATLLVLAHGFFNSKPLTIYLKREMKKGMSPWLFALLVCFVTVVIAFFI